MCHQTNTGPVGAVGTSSANGLGSYLGTCSNPEQVFKAQWVGVRPLHPFLSYYTLTGLLISTNLLS